MRTVLRHADSGDVAQHCVGKSCLFKTRVRQACKTTMYPWFPPRSGAIGQLFRSSSPVLTVLSPTACWKAQSLPPCCLHDNLRNLGCSDLTESWSKLVLQSKPSPSCITLLMDRDDICLYIEQCCQHYTRRDALLSRVCSNTALLPVTESINSFWLDDFDIWCT